MRNLRQRLSAIFVIGGLFIGFAIQAKAQNKTELNDTVNQITAKITDFQYNFNSDVNRNSVSRIEEEQMGDLLRNLRSDVESFQENLNNSNETRDDVMQIIDSGNLLNNHLLTLKLSAKTQNDWKSIRSNLDRLATNFQITTNWSTSAKQVSTMSSSNNNLTGTYQIDVSRSDNLGEIIGEAITTSNVQNADEVRQDLEKKLASPETLAIEINGSKATIASTLSSQITLSADANDRTQTLPDGTTMRMRTVLRGQELTIAKLGDEEDYTVVFTSMDNGKTLKVTRRITTSYLSETLFAGSIYTKSDSVARLDVFEKSGNSANDANATTETNETTETTEPVDNNLPRVIVTSSLPPSPKARNAAIGQYIVGNGEILTATLENMISTKISQNNDRFKATVVAPSQYRGAIIEGYVSGIDRSNRNPIGKSKVTFNFERIRLTNGQIYDFAGFLQSVTDKKGKTIKVDEEGTATKSSTRETAKRGGIGAGAGAVIGAIFGGAKGAVIGATIGAGAGAGTVAIENKGDLVIEEGSSISVQASSPSN